MTIFDKREKGSETKFAVDAELQFKIRARRNKLVGLWAAEKMGLTEDKAKDYAFSIIDEDAKVAGDSDVISKLVADFANAKVAITEEQVKNQLVDYESEAKKQLLGN